MSSKSRKHSPSAQVRHEQTPERAATAPAPSEAEHKGALGIPDEIIHVPKKANPLRFMLMVGLVIVLLLLFAISPQTFLSIFGSDEDVAYMTWQHPTRGKVEVSGADFYVQKRAIADALELDGLLRFSLGVFENTPTDEDVARILVLDELAQASGLFVSDLSLAQHIMQLVSQSPLGEQRWRQIVADRGRGIEETLRRCVRAQRYLLLLVHLAAVPDAGRIQELFQQDHVEFAFDYVALDTSSELEAARAELPDDAGLEAWFQARSEGEKQAFEAPEERAAEFVVFSDFAATPAAGLLAKYPSPEGADPDADAQAYYNQVYYYRFVRPKPAEGEAPPDQAQSFYLTFDEVRERCKAEAPVHRALHAWLAELGTRATNGETIDLVAEASALGLAHEATDAPIDRAAYSEREGLNGPALSATIFAEGALPEAYSKNLFVSEEGLAVVRVGAIVPAAIPPLAEIRAGVAATWAELRAGELALAGLAALRDAQAEIPPAADAAADAPVRRSADEAAFAAAATAAGLSVARRDWLDKKNVVTPDPKKSDPAHVFLRDQRGYYDLAENEVAEPKLDAQAKSAYLTRLAGKRALPIERMSPDQYQGYKSRTALMSGQDMKRTFVERTLRDQYGLTLYRTSEVEGADEPGG
jgi:hypothetical protein